MRPCRRRPTSATRSWRARLLSSATGSSRLSQGAQDHVSTRVLTRGGGGHAAVDVYSASAKWLWVELSYQKQQATLKMRRDHVSTHLIRGLGHAWVDVHGASACTSFWSSAIESSGLLPDAQGRKVTVQASVHSRVGWGPGGGALVGVGRPSRHSSCLLRPWRQRTTAQVYLDPVSPCASGQRWRPVQKVRSLAGRKHQECPNC
jgi:hypothetical protein